MLGCGFHSMHPRLLLRRYLNVVWHKGIYQPTPYREPPPKNIQYHISSKNQICVICKKLAIMEMISAETSRFIPSYHISLYYLFGVHHIAAFKSTKWGKGKRTGSQYWVDSFLSIKFQIRTCIGFFAKGCGQGDADKINKRRSAQQIFLMLFFSFLCSDFSLTNIFLQPVNTKTKREKSEEKGEKRI